MHIITSILALFGAFCLFIISGIFALFLHTLHGFAKEDRQRKQVSIAEREAEKIIQWKMK